MVLCPCAQNCLIYYEPSCAEPQSECMLCACGYETDVSGACVERLQSDPANCLNCQSTWSCGTCGPGHVPRWAPVHRRGHLAAPAGRRGLLTDAEGGDHASVDLLLETSFAQGSDSVRQVPAVIGQDTDVVNFVHSQN